MHNIKKIKVGIITHYNNSRNYGGVLQAYALCRILKQLNVDSEQISFPLTVTYVPWKKVPTRAGQKILYYLRQGILVNLIIGKLKTTLRSFALRFMYPELKQKRTVAFSHFTNDLIPHSSKVYTSESIHECAELYDIFITGSDQVWNLHWYNPAYFLDFVPEGKPKYSYAASMSMDFLTADEESLLREHLKGFSDISVREYQTADNLSEILGRSVHWVLDPTLLLSTEEWSGLCTARMIEEPYMFCYFLNKENTKRRAASMYAKQKNLKIVTIPHLNGSFTATDMYFGDIRLEAPSPEQFLSLIKYASCIFTDSFHATVFSYLFEKEYYVFCRDRQKGMDLRIYSLLELFGTQERFCNTREKCNLDYLFQLKKLDYSSISPIFQSLKEESVAFLTRIVASTGMSKKE